MTDPSLGSASRPLHVAIVGSGPSAFYAAEALQKVKGLDSRIDMFDRLPTPFGLVRGGVAPDHQKIKSVVKIYERIASHDDFRFFGNVRLGRDVRVEELTAHYDQIVYALGNESARNLGIPGEELIGVHSATEFVFWYNGHPDYSDLIFDLKGATRAVVVGNGNVAMDVARVLIQDPEGLAATDIADHALETLRESGIREVVLLGRRGPAQAAFSPKEIKEIAELEGVDLVVSEDDATLDEVTLKWLEDKAPKSARKNSDFLAAQAAKGEGTAERKIRCRFLVSPVELQGEGRMERVRIRHSELGPDTAGTPRPKPIDNYEEFDAQLVFKAIGYRGIPIEGVPFDRDWGTIPNEEGRVTTERGGEVVPDQYVVGWSKRGPSGLIGTNSPDSKATVEKMVEDIRGRTAGVGAGDFTAILDAKNLSWVSFEDWQRYDTWEQQEGGKRGRVRQKLTSINAIVTKMTELRV